jgi:hypothetical protein
VKPELVRDRQALLTAAARAQGRRFLVAQLSAIARGDFALAAEYQNVLEQLHEIGLSRAYPRLAGLLMNPVGRQVLSAAATLRRARARRMTESVRARAS